MIDNVEGDSVVVGGDSSSTTRLSDWGAGDDALSDGAAVVPS